MSQKNKRNFEVGGIEVLNSDAVSVGGAVLHNEIIVSSGDWVAGDAGERTAFIAKEGWIVTGVSAVASTDSGSSTADFTVEKNGTDAVLASAIDLDGSLDHIVINGTLSSTTANLSLGVDDNLQVTLTGSATSMIGAVVNIRLKRAAVA